MYISQSFILIVHKLVKTIGTIDIDTIYYVINFCQQQKSHLCLHHDEG